MLVRSHGQCMAGENVTMTCEIPLSLATSTTYLAILGPCVFAFVLIAVVALLGKAPTPAKKFALAVAVLASLGTAGHLVWQARSAHVTVGPETLMARAGMDAMTFPLDALRWHEAVDAGSLRFPLRKFGTSLPGMQAGRFSREGGKDVFLLRSAKPSTLIPSDTAVDLVLPTSAYERIRECAPATKGA